MTTATHAARTPDSSTGNPRSSVTLLDAIDRHARDRAEHAAIISLDPRSVSTHSTTWAELADLSHRAAAAVSQIAPAGSPVVLAVPNGPEFAAVFLGTLLAGHHVFPVPPSAGPGEIVRAARACHASLVVTDLPEPPAFPASTRAARTAELLITRRTPPPREREPSHAAVLLHSSGTTGLPKIVRRSLRALDAVALAVAEAAVLTASDRVLAAIPMSHSYGMENSLLAPILAGATILSIPSLSAPSLDAALRHGFTVLPAVPFLIEALAQRPRCSHTRLIYSAGAALPHRVAGAFERAWHRRAGSLYGATEIGSVTFGDPACESFDAESVGTAMRACEIVVTNMDTPSPSRPLPPGEEGHILVRSASMLDAYLDAPDPLIDGFFPTGDLGTLDPRGNLRLTGRLKLMIDIGGAKVNPLEVERVLCAFPGIAECVVVPAAVTATVSRLRAVMVPHQGSTPPSGADLRAFARDRLATHKVPRLYEFRDRLPRSPTGKVLRRRIEAEL